MSNPADWTVNEYLEKAKTWGMHDVLIVGRDEDGTLITGGTIDSLEDNGGLLDEAKMWINLRAEEQSA